MTRAVQVAIVACILRLSEARPEQETVHSVSHIIKQEQDAATAKGIMRRQLVNKHDHGREVTVFSSGGFTEATPSSANAPAVGQLAGVSNNSISGTGANEQITGVNGTEALKVGSNATGNATGPAITPSSSLTNSSSGGADTKPPETGATASCFIAKGLKVITLKDADGQEFQMAVRSDKDDVSQRLIKKGYYQIRKPAELAALAGKQMPSDGTLLDIGASLGWYTMLFARAGYKVVAVEPIAMNRIALNATLCLNPSAAANVKVLPIALVANEDRKKTCVMTARGEDQQGAGTISCSADPSNLPCSPANSSSSSSLLEQSNMPCYGITVSTLDMLLSQMAPIVVDFVKIDVDGLECDVMQSGESIFWRYNVKFLQVTTKKSPVAQCFTREAKRHGYVVGKHEGDDLDKVMYRHRDVSLTQSSGKDFKKPVTFTLSRAFE